MCINNGEGIQYNSTQNTEAALDLTFLSSATAGVSAWSVLNHTTVGRNHYPVVTKIGSKIYYDKGKKLPRWKLGNANWAAFQEIRANRCMKLQEENQMDVNIFNGELVY